MCCLHFAYGMLWMALFIYFPTEIEIYLIIDFFIFKCIIYLCMKSQFNFLKLISVFF